MASTTLYFFGDQTGAVLPVIQDLSKLAQQGSEIQRFLRNSTNRLKSAIAQTQPEQRKRFPTFENPLELATSFDSEIHNPAIASALLCISQLGHAIM